MNSNGWITDVNTKGYNKNILSSNSPIHKSNDLRIVESFLVKNSFDDNKSYNSPNIRQKYLFLKQIF